MSVEVAKYRLIYQNQYVNIIQFIWISNSVHYCPVHEFSKALSVFISFYLYVLTGFYLQKFDQCPTSLDPLLCAVLHEGIDYAL
jgi:hypothetical protein